MYLVGFIIRIYHDGRSPKRQIRNNSEQVPHISQSRILCTHVPYLNCPLISCQVFQDLSTSKTSRNSPKCMSTFFWPCYKHVVRVRTGLKWLRMSSRAGFLVFILTKREVPFSQLYLTVKLFRTRELIFFLMNEEVHSTMLPVQFNHKPEEPLRMCDRSLDPHGHSGTVGERCYGILWLLMPVAHTGGPRIAM